MRKGTKIAFLKQYKIFWKFGQDESNLIFPHTKTKKNYLPKCQHTQKHANTHIHTHSKLVNNIITY